MSNCLIRQGMERVIVIVNISRAAYSALHHHILVLSQILFNTFRIVIAFSPYQSYTYPCALISAFKKYIFLCLPYSNKWPLSKGAIRRIFPKRSSRFWDRVLPDSFDNMAFLS